MIYKKNKIKDFEMVLQKGSFPSQGKLRKNKK